MKKVDVIIPLYKPGKEITELLGMLAKQTLKPHAVIFMNTCEELFREELIAEPLRGSDIPYEVHHLTKAEFDHAATRQSAVGFSTADYFVMMTQDARPYDEFLLENLTAHLEGDVAVAYGRQLPNETCAEMEKISRYFNYPDVSRKKTLADMDTLGIKAFFCSDVCAAYRRDLFEELGGYVDHAIFNEDMIYASKVIRSGYAVYYEAEAKVVHSHNYTNMQQLRRNFDLGVSQAENPDVFGNVKSESEGKKLVKETCKHLCKMGKWYVIPKFGTQCVHKYLGYKLGKNYRKLPRNLILSLTTNKEYWKV